MGSLRHLILIIIAWTLICAHPVTAGTATLDWMPSLIIQNYQGTARNINNLTMEVDISTTNATFQLLGTDDQKIYTLIDSRKDVTLNAGSMEQFNFTNAGSFKYYFLTLISGFDTGTVLEYHLDHTASDFNPKEQLTPYYNFTQKRSPLVFVIDFTKNDLPATRQNYTITSAASFGAVQTWYIFGTNSSVFLGTSNPALLTLLDTQTGIAFAGGVPQSFDISTLPPFKTYVIYVEEGFPTFGTKLEFRIWGKITAAANNATATIVTNVSEPHLNIPIGFHLEDNVTVIDNVTWNFGDGNTSTSWLSSNTYGWAANFEVTAYACNDTFNECYTVTDWLWVLFYTCLLASEPGRLPILFLYLLVPLAVGLSLFSVWSYNNRVYANIVLGGFGSSVLWFFMAANIITGNIFYVSTNRTCVMMDTSLFWLFILFGSVMSLYSLLLTVEAITEKRKGAGGEI